MTLGNTNKSSWFRLLLLKKKKGLCFCRLWGQWKVRKTVPCTSGPRLFISNCSIALLPIFNFAKHATVSICCNPLFGDFIFQSCFKLLWHNKDLKSMGVVSSICLFNGSELLYFFFMYSITLYRSCSLTACIFAHVKPSSSHFVMC